MIIDHISHIEKYGSFGPGFESGIRFLLQHQNDPAEPVARYKLDENVDVMVNQYETKYPEESNFEAHNKYIDVHLC
jgi:beta-galactosidase beta subunit